MKKRILAMLLSALLVANINACSQPANNIPENKTEDSVESIVEKTTETEESNNELPNQNETLRDVPELGQLKLFTSRNLTTASIWTDQKGEYYIYINEWDAYRHLRGLSSYHFLYFAPYGYASDNNIVVESETATIAIIDQDGKHDEPTLITYHFNKSNNLVELHAVPLNIKANSEYDTYIVNMHDADHGYYFLTPRIDGRQDWRINEFQGSDVDKFWGWPWFMFETTDGGKSWNQISTNTFFPGASDCINILKFGSPQVGIISFRYVEVEDLCDRTYLTLDGGLTWTQLSQLPYPFDLNKPRTWYSEIIDFDQNDDRYYLTVKVCGTLEAVEGSDYSFPSEYTTIGFCFESKDLINWNLIED